MHYNIISYANSKMKKTLFLFLTVLFFSCDDKIERISFDPQLNIEEYTFPKEGGSIKVYSKAGNQLMLCLNPLESDTDESIINRQKYVGAVMEIFNGGWFFVVKSLKDTIRIEVDENTGGAVRTVPLFVASKDFLVRTRFKQLAD